MNKQPTVVSTGKMRRLVAAVAVGLALTGIAGCVMVPPGESAQVMEEADAALQTAGVGWIDGNDIGNYQYDLFFSGTDSAAMWKVLEPVFAEAPLRWTSVELRDGLDDQEPTIIARK